jgi:hypothetical protein
MDYFTPIDMRGNQIHGVGDPDIDADAANKGYVDGHTATPPGFYISSINESPTPIPDGTNRVFTLENNYVPGSTSAYKNGLLDLRGPDYVETLPNKITYTTAPLSDDDLVVSYLVQ